ncbi:MAG TPA: CocE/NonD family hydrolase [Gaiellaceae bacterium]|nr:CocE/NonD family hydrolase [Gaiellaceae bacterium]
MENAAPHPSASKAFLSRIGAALRTETGLVRLALGLVALHVADDNFFQPAAGTSPGDHLVSGLVPIAILALVAWLYPRLRAGFRAATAMTFGAIAIAVGAPAAYYLAKGIPSGDAFTGLLALAAGIGLLLSGPVTLWRHRRRGGSRRRRYLRRTLTLIGGLVAAILVAWFVVFPVGASYVFTHAGRTASTPELGVTAAEVTVTTSDSLELQAWYVPSKNRAAVVVYPGATRAKQARMLIEHGYGVLLLEARGQGESEGDVDRWAGDRDLLAGAAFLRNRPDVDPERIGGIGFSVGGELLLEAAARSTAFAAIVSEGAGERIGEVDASGPERLLAEPAMAVMTAAMSVFSNHGPPPAIVDRIGLIAPRPVFLIYADPGIGGESTRQPKYFDAAGEPKAIWKVPDAGHTGGLDAAPAEYERRVVGFFDQSLLDR